MRHPLVACALAICGSATAAEAAPAGLVDWPALRAPAARVADAADAFATLPDAQIDALRVVVRGRRADASAGPGAEETRQRGVMAEAGLRAQGVDVDGLLARREQLMAQGRAADEAGVPALDGAPVRLVGQLLPVAREDGAAAAYVLLPWAGACSHQPPPPANQAVRLRPVQADAAALSAGPVWVSGVLRVQPSSVVVFRVDGLQALRSTYALEGAEITPMQPEVATLQRFR